MAEDPAARIVIISDVHIGAGELDDFRPELESHLIRFLDELAECGEPVELVINGDFFDFATAEPFDGPDLEARSAGGIPLCFTQAQSLQKLENMIASHGPIFGALAEFLGSDANNRIAMLPGNHDVDLFWPDVRCRLRDELRKPGVESNDRLTFVLEPQHVVGRSGARYWIEHGHQHDRNNSFFVDGKPRWSQAAPPILMDATGTARLLECPGTLGLVRYINGWRRDYPSISYIKPLSRVLRALATYRAFKKPGRPILLAWHLAHFLGWDVDWKTALDESDDVKRACHDALREVVSNLGTDEELNFVRYLKAQGINSSITLRNYVDTAVHRDQIIRCVATAEGAANKAEPIRVDDASLGFAANCLIDIETRALTSMARRLAKSGSAHYVLVGHTHSPGVRLKGQFLNSGCWIANHDVMTTGDAKSLIFEHGLIPYRLTYLEIPKDAFPVLKTYKLGSIKI